MLMLLPVRILFSGALLLGLLLPGRAMAQCITTDGPYVGQTATLLVIDNCGNSYETTYDLSGGVGYCPNLPSGCLDIERIGWRFPSGDYLVPAGSSDVFVIPELNPIPANHPDTIFMDIIMSGLTGGPKVVTTPL